ncbi:phosphate/phosphite/phosphonate ABC transporter substrate-binding protein [Caulobacter soli]|uniref:phosphate/phosphite/phosphonate ABC transporter substrate-binding protein n=1 Tax=Caulobacter soli TaxID=2708539 RepID=UPI0013ED7AF6|nr:PhnD/SsuA/transferrin family substrate-binding protein [Caulobacter soli]
MTAKAWARRAPARTAAPARGKAALAMYDLPELREANDALWAAIATRLRARKLFDVPDRLTRDVAPDVLWTDPDLILAQTCGLPLATRLDRQVRVVATPRYRARGCDGTDYRSAVVVRADHAASSLNDLRAGRCAVNDLDSNSGMNLLRAEVAPLARGKTFFKSVIITGSHLASAEAVATDEADVAALDCVTFAHLQRWRPELAARLRVLTWTVRSPGLPLITSLTTSPAQLAGLRAVLDEVAAEPELRDAREALLLDGFSMVPAEQYRAVLRLRDIARDLGYPHLA